MSSVTNSIPRCGKIFVVIELNTLDKRQHKYNEHIGILFAIVTGADFFSFLFPCFHILKY